MLKFQKFVDKITSTHLTRVFTVFTILFSVIAILLYWWAGLKLEQTLTEQMLHREQIIVRAGSQAVENYLNDIGKSMVVLAKGPRIITMRESTQGALNDFVGVFKNSPLTSTIVADKKGVVLFNANNLGGPREIGVTVRDREYFNWAIKASEGELFLGKPVVSRVGATKGKYIIPIATPIFDNKKFKGVFAAAILLSKLTENYLDPLKISDKTRVYLINNKGVLLYSSNENLTGVNYLDYLKNKPFRGSEEIRQSLNSRVMDIKEGKLDVYLPNEQKGGALTRFLIAHAGLTFKDQKLLLAVAMPIDEAMVFVGPLATNQRGEVIFGLLSLAIVSLLFIFGTKIVARSSYLEGFAEGRDHKINSKIKNQNAK